MEKQKKSKWFWRAEPKDRIVFLAIFLAVCVIFGLFWLAAKGVINLSPLGECAFKRNYGIPCPTCGFTTAISVFVTGGIIKAFWIQPAAAAMCVVLLLAAFFSLLSATTGINFSFLPPIRIWRIEYLLIAGAIILAASWAVTIARALAELP
ncbi:MAG: DUF2752 domain-containing protein [Planctomycetes bacterium]|nr:DUF2752 domain-containing protein [Planctomycetota bacterium]MBU1518129.1 DUF2752 domain-containing protein [Planctomycetota bacterium]MBU2457758.1 DUF2752 domain-containing protein [Planctomycetota bacterium]